MPARTRQSCKLREPRLPFAGWKVIMPEDEATAARQAAQGILQHGIIARVG